MRSWDIFCKVIDNYGDIGVCWRLAADLSARGHRVRLWVDDARALAWMAPGALEGAFPRLQVLRWEQSRAARTLATLEPAEVWIEGFGCDLEPEFVADRCAPNARASDGQVPMPVWINLEYLTAESYAARAHGLPSPIMQGPARGHTRWFFYPGLTPQTGGLLREPDLERRLAAFERHRWLAGRGIDWVDQRLVSLFCYEPRALPDLLDQCRRGPEPTCLLVTPGRASAAVKTMLGLGQASEVAGQSYRTDALSMVFLPELAQPEFDHLLWACDLNFVRGEDSLVRALWSGRAFVWQIYPQHDNAHHAKLLALLDALEAPPSWRSAHLAWNGIGTGPLLELHPGPWGEAAGLARRDLAQQTDLTTRLCLFVDKVLAASRAEAKKS